LQPLHCATRSQVERQQLLALTQTPGSVGLAHHPLQLSKKKSLFFGCTAPHCPAPLLQLEG
jgi:hypothetical protein